MSRPRKARDAIACMRTWRAIPKERAHALLASIRDDINLLSDEGAKAADRGAVDEAIGYVQHCNDLRAAHNALAALAFLDDEIT